MGNWRTVTLVGTCPVEQLEALRHATRDPYHRPLDERLEDSAYHCLTTNDGLCGLGDWPAERIDVSGNLAERDYRVLDVAHALRQLVEAAPGLSLRIHCGGEYESEECVATVVAEQGEVTIRP